MRLPSLQKKNFKKRGVHAALVRGWEFVVLFTLLVSVVFLAFGFKLFIDTNRGLETPPAGSDRKLVDRGRIDRALRIFSEREQRTAEILSSPAPVVDPSR